MNKLSAIQNHIPEMSIGSIEKVRQLESCILHMPQVKIEISHIIHAGVYARTALVPAGVLITGAFIKIPTTLIIQGNIIAYIGDEAIAFSGYNVVSASANRKQSFFAKSDSYITMLFATTCNSVEEAEREFTDEFNLLIPCNQSNEVTICQE